MAQDKLTLLVLAAGMGSRYGGLKQLDAVGPAGETIIDYSIYDALQAGFNKLVFIIRNEFLDEFRQRITDKFADKAEIHFVHQDVTTPIDGIDMVTERSKPWGTGHAVLVARDVIREPFAVINADDFYGRDGFRQVAGFLRDEVRPDLHCIIGYVLKNTLSDNGHVSRGVCQVDSDLMLTAINERTKIHRDGSRIVYEDDGAEHEVDESSVVSMNFWGFHHSIFDHLYDGFKTFAQANTDNPKAEYFIPLVADNLIRSGQGGFAIKTSDDKWFGVTYKEDKPEVQAALLAMSREGRYPDPVW